MSGPGAKGVLRCGHSWRHGRCRAGEAVRLTEASGSRIAILSCLAMLAATFAVAWAIHWMSRTYGARQSLGQCYALATWTATPLFLVGVVQFQPVRWMSFIVGLPVLAYTVFLFYLGVPVTGTGATAPAASTSLGRAVREAAKLEDVRIHDLRHSFASRALALGETLRVIGRLLGHNDIETTARFAHLTQDSVHDAGERIAGSIAADILSTPEFRRPGDMIASVSPKAAAFKPGPAIFRP